MPASTSVWHSTTFLHVTLKLSYLAGGSVGLLALNALFVLMKDYNLCGKLVSHGQLASDLVYIVTILPFIPACMPSLTVTCFI